VRRVIRASLGNRAKESLMVDFINQTNLDEIPDKASVIEAFFNLHKPSKSAKRRVDSPKA
jgi:type I restriction enzyme, R subunit